MYVNEAEREFVCSNLSILLVCGDATTILARHRQETPEDVARRGVSATDCLVRTSSAMCKPGGSESFLWQMVHTHVSPDHVDSSREIVGRVSCEAVEFSCGWRTASMIRNLRILPITFAGEE